MMKTFFRKLLSWRVLLILAMLAAVTRIVSLVVVDSGPAAARSMSGEEDDFVSYFQSALGMASGLLTFESRDHFLSIDPITQKTFAEIVEQRFVDLILFREKALVLTSEDRRRFAEKHAELIRQTKTAFEILQKQQAKYRMICGDRWDDYWAALQYDFVATGEAREDDSSDSADR